MCTIAEKLVNAWEDGKMNLGDLATFCRDSGLVIQSDLNDNIGSDFYTFADTSVLEIDWIKSEAYC